MSVKYEGERSIDSKYEAELLAKNEINISNCNTVRVVTMLLFRSYSEVTVPYPTILCSHLEINLCKNWGPRCSKDHALLREFSYIENILAGCKLYYWCLLLRLITSEPW